ncbi:proteasome subunit beta type-5-like protein [Trifolium pratense]|uniref:Proteasome subunit beta type-5-like protein n=1 Tax=Trifolium pratense TaxID=57577 RepID=A0A2K3KMP4_TRIPR|nr:proteasome subunit beta type-5-like protein [Trifolium pratense]
MKLDTSGLESFPSLISHGNDVAGEISAPPSFELPNSNNFDGFLKEAIQMVKPAKGTTTLAFIFKEGVMVAADSRASMGGYICGCLSTLLFGTASPRVLCYEAWTLTPTPIIILRK